MPEVGAIEMDTENFGTLSLDDFLARPESYAQGYLVVHRGDVVYEAYPGMKPSDHHVWMSSAKPTASLLIELLIDEGQIDDANSVSAYLTDFEGTVWDDVTVNNLLNMAAGTNTEENDETRADPDSIATRVFLAEFGMSYQGSVESLVAILKEAKAVNPPGEKFEYGSPLTQILVLIVETVEQKRWHQVFEERVWSKVGSEGPFLAHTTPDGVTVAHGLVSTRLRDKARFGMLYTPSWSKISTKRVVTDKILKRIRDDVQDHDFMMRGFDGPTFAGFVGEKDNPSFIANSRQWDLLWPDGDMMKFGLMTQGLYVSPDRDLVIVYFSTNNDDHSAHRYARRIATSGLFDD